jgi:hypothetical protein
MTRKPAQHPNRGKQTILTHWLRWLMGAAAGAATFLWITPSPIPILATAWYVLVTIGWLSALSHILTAGT